MNTEPAAIRDIVTTAPPIGTRLAQQRRVVFAIVLLVGSVVTVALDEAERWQPSVDLGLQLSDSFNRIAAVTPGGLADRAGLTPAIIVGIDDVTIRDDAHRRSRRALHDTLFVELDGSVHTRPGVEQIVVHVRPPVDGDVICGDRVPPFDPTSDPIDDVVITIADTPTTIARDPIKRWNSFLAMPFVLLLALVLGALASLRPWPRHDVVTLARLREHSFVWPAVASPSSCPCGPICGPCGCCAAPSRGTDISSSSPQRYPHGSRSR